jgi:hypothetical protein
VEESFADTRVTIKDIFPYLVRVRTIEEWERTQPLDNTSSLRIVPPHLLRKGEDRDYTTDCPVGFALRVMNAPFNKCVPFPYDMEKLFPNNGYVAMADFLSKWVGEAQYDDYVLRQILL